ncbi:MAG TPA: hypothetical protein PLI10_06085 [Bacillota bacterium]|nr:hypothetical protein [Bacillota bacterium]
MGRWLVKAEEVRRWCLRVNAGEGLTLGDLGWFIGLIGMSVGIYGGLRNGRRDSDAAAREMATILTSLEYLKKSVDCLSGQMTANQNAMVEIIARLGGVEKSVARAHSRIDRMCDGSGAGAGSSGMGGGGGAGSGAGTMDEEPEGKWLKMVD